MPIEIRELVIRAKVDRNPRADGSAAGSAAADAAAADMPEAAQQALIDACVRRVLDVLAARQER